MVDHWRCVDETSFSPFKSPAVSLVEGDRTKIAFKYIEMHQILILFPGPSTHGVNH